RDEGRFAAILRGGVVRNVVLGGVRAPGADAAHPAVGSTGAAAAAGRGSGDAGTEHRRRSLWLQPRVGDAPATAELQDPRPPWRNRPPDRLVQSLTSGVFPGPQSEASRAHFVLIVFRVSQRLRKNPKTNSARTMSRKRMPRKRIGALPRISNSR